MKNRRGWWVRFGLVLVASVGRDLVDRTRAKNFLSQIVAPPLPNLPPNGAWGEVIFANNKWLVIQNHEKQQFPISIDATHIRQFLVRWPIQERDLTVQSMVEAFGPDLGNNTIQVEHVDVFEGADQTLVAPTYRSTLPNAVNPLVTTIDPTYNRLLNAWDYGAQSMLYGWAFPVPMNLQGIPSYLHVVGNSIGVSPLRLTLPGNNFATVVPAAESFTMTQVTYGSASFLQKGDLVFLTPINVTPKSLVLQQLVLYKKVPRSQFAP